MEYEKSSNQGAIKPSLSGGNAGSSLTLGKIQTQTAAEEVMPFWNKRLQQLSRKRWKIWLRWKNLGAEDSYDEYLRLYKTIKKEVNKNKRRIFNQFLDKLNSDIVNAQIGTLNRVLRAKAANSRENVASMRRKGPAEFTGHLLSAAKPPIGEPQMMARNFHVDDDWQTDIERTIQNAPRLKATGSDELFAEALEMNAAKSAKLLVSV